MLLLPFNGLFRIAVVEQSDIGKGKAGAVQRTALFIYLFVDSALIVILSGVS